MSIIDELKKERLMKDCNIDKLVDSLYISCIKCIKFHNKNGKTKYTFEVPTLTIGYPLYPREDISLKLNKLLKKNGFKTLYDNFKIYISW